MGANPVTVVTGGARGIGHATAKALLARGARVAVGDLDPEAVGEAAARLGSDVVSGVLDVADAASWDAFLGEVREELGPIDVLVNNAGIMPLGPLLEEDVLTAERIMAVNFHGVLHGMKHVLPEMLARGAGHVVNVASAAGRAPVPGAATYGASKAAVLSLTETARVEHADAGVDFTCVLPSFTNTELVAGTKGTRFVATVSPEAVGTAIADVVERPKPDVFVPRPIGGMLKVQLLFGRRVRDGMNRALGADRTFLEVDASQRAGYLARLEREALERPRLESPQK